MFDQGQCNTPSGRLPYKPRSLRRYTGSNRDPTEEIISAVAFVTVFVLVLVRSEDVSGSPVPTIIFHGRASCFHAFVLALNFAFTGGVMTIFLRQLYPKIARYTRLLSVLSMAVAVGVFSWLAVPLLFQTVASVVFGRAATA